MSLQAIQFWNVDYTEDERDLLQILDHAHTFLDRQGVPRTSTEEQTNE